jgi:hypothetical protein
VRWCEEASINCTCSMRRHTCRPFDTYIHGSCMSRRARAGAKGRLRACLHSETPRSCPSRASCRIPKSDVPGHPSEWDHSLLRPVHRRPLYRAHFRAGFRCCGTRPLGASPEPGTRLGPVRTGIVNDNFKQGTRLGPVRTGIVNDNFKQGPGAGPGDKGGSRNLHSPECELLCSSQRTTALTARQAASSIAGSHHRQSRCQYTPAILPLSALACTIRPQLPQSPLTHCSW